MKRFNFTADQGKAIQTRGADLLVSASAGSGKTTVMVERIAQMLRNRECEFKALLVLTFTNASAADMRAKLRRRLAELGVNTDNLSEVSIGTFHKFCGEVVRTYFNIAGVSPDFAIMDEIAADYLKQEVLGEVIMSSYQKCAMAIETFCVNRKVDVFAKMLVSISDFLATREDAQDWLDKNALAAYTTDVALNCILDYYRQAGEYYLRKFKCFDDDECKMLAGKLLYVKKYDDLHGFALTAEFTRLKKGADGEFKELRERFKELVKKIKNNYSLPFKIMEENGSRDREIIKQVIFLVREFEAAYSVAKLSANKLDFNDLEKYTCAVLADPEIAAVLRARYKYIFIDEYQDTNPMQERILARVADNCSDADTVTQRVAGSKNVFMVGDVKQSIYGFRGCEAAIFAGKMTDFDKNLSGKVVLLNENFRSRANILRFANLVFGKVMKRETCDIDYDATSRFAVDGSGGAVDVTLINTPRGTAAELQAAVVAQKAADLQEQGAALKDIAILARSRTHFDVLAGTLERAGFAVSVAAEQNACELAEIATLNNMLFAVSNFCNDVPLVLLMQSFVFGFTVQDMAELKISGGEEGQPFYKNLLKSKSKKVSEFLAFLDKYRGLSKTNSVADVLTIFLTEYRITERLLLSPQGKRAVNNINAYLNKLRQASYAATVSEFLYLLENEQIEIKITPPADNGDAIQILTMHSSKGLEFKNVIIFDAGAAFNLNDTKQLMVIDKVQGLCVATVDADEFTKTMSIARLGAVISARRVLVAEEMRLLYVAMTRAKERLVIVGGANLEKFGAGFENFDVIGAKSDLHFLAPALFSDVREDCFELKVINADEVVTAKKGSHKKTLTGIENEVAKNLRKIYTKEYPHKQAVLKNSVTGLTGHIEIASSLRSSQRRAPELPIGKEYGTQFHKQMQNLSTADLLALIPEIRGCEIHREIAFLQSVNRDGTDIIVQGVIDLLAFCGGHAVIVDYKTTRATPEKLVELYKPQLDMYAAAVKQSFSPREIDVYIYSSFNKKLIKV